MKIILVGLAGSGKTTVRRLLEERMPLGYEFMDVDTMVRNIWNGSDKDPRAANIRGFVKTLLPDYEPDHDGLQLIKRAAFSNADLRKELETATKEYVGWMIGNVMKFENIVLEYPLIGQMGDVKTATTADLILAVDAPEPIRRRRLELRGWLPDEIDEVMAAQRLKKPLYEVLKQPVDKLKILESLPGPEFNHRIANFINNRRIEFIEEKRRKSYPRPRIGVVGGSFDPITKGHLNMIEQAAQCVDFLYVLPAINSAKKTLLPQETILRTVLTDTQALEARNIAVSFVSEGESLASYAKTVGASIIFRGIRGATDLEYERAVADVTKRLAPDVSLNYILPPAELITVSSSLVRNNLSLREWELVVKPMVTEATFEELATIRELRQIGPA